MKGSYTVKVRNRRVTYTIELERNLTVICGDSATGKTTLINSIAFYEEFGDKSGVTIDSSKECHVLKGKNWYSDLVSFKDSFVFVDEGNDFLFTKEFASAISKTDNYYIFVTRENLYQLPYSAKSILELKKTTSRFKHTYNRTYPLYDHLEEIDDMSTGISAYLVEDSNSGFDLFSLIADRRGIKCISAHGKNRILSKLENLKKTKVVVVADGAAFGANMAGVYDYTLTHTTDVLLYLPESTEWLILSSGIIKDKEIDSILNSPADYIESEKYMSWEQYFTHLLKAKTQGTIAEYSKKHLNEYYTNNKNIEQIIKAIRGS